MRQNSFLHAEQLAGNAVVPVEANGVHATAFFISPNQLLTARHFVIDAEVEEDEPDVIVIHVGGKNYYCTYNDINSIDTIKKVDAVVLTTQNFHQAEEYTLELLSTPMIPKQKLKIIGYPKELGSNVDYFTIDVENYKDLKEWPLGYDTLVRRTEDNFFQSYKGFSGAPVLNQCNQVIGLVTDQFTGSLAYMSIYRMIEQLEPIDVSFSKDAESADDRTFGLLTSRMQVARSIEKASSRYNEQLHQENKTLTSFLDNVTKRNSVNPYLRIWDQYVKWFSSIGRSFDKYPRFMQAIRDLEAKKYSTISFKDIQRLVCAKEKGIDLLDKDDCPDERLIERLREIGYELFDIEEAEKEYSTQFVCIAGSAGTGKTHLLCHYAKLYNRYSHAYLLFGPDFKEGTHDAFDEILDMISMSLEDIEELNNHLELTKRYGIIVIDALNEGAGQHYWKQQLPSLINQIKKYPRIKLIISARCDSDKYILKGLEDEFLCPEVIGFENPEIAVEAYFKAFNIPDRMLDFYRNFATFQNPLFLYIFCTAYHRMPYRVRMNMTHLIIYRYYLIERNQKVSEIVDEDPWNNITTKYLLELAKHSVAEHNCDVFERESAREIANSMAIVPGWNHNLLNACEIENLLRLTLRNNKGWCTAFEFENLGDFLKAKVWRDEFMDKPYSELLVNIKNRLSQPDSTKDLEHALEALLSIYESKSGLWDEKDIIDGDLTKYVLNSLQYHRSPKEFEDYTLRIVRGIYQNNKELISPQFLSKQISDIGKSAMKLLHDDLKSKSQNDLDEFWTDRVNRLFSGKRGNPDLNFKAIIHNKDKALPHVMLMCWFCASSYPIVRAYAQRALFEDFLNCPEVIMDTLKLFRDVRDPYVIQGLYAALYGFMLKQVAKEAESEPLFDLDQSTSIEHIADYIYEQYYCRPELVPQDIVVRYWQLKILERVAYLKPKSEHWGKIKALKRFKAQKSPMYNGEEALEDKKDYLGIPETKYSALVDSLFNHMSDFCRYTLHMNNTMFSRTYFEKKDDKDSGVSMLRVQRSIIQLLKNEIEWNDRLESLDSSHSSSGRMNNEKERIGKKYQWMALFKIEAYLSDTCYMRDEYWSSDSVVENNFPWYSPNRPYFDPTLSVANLEVGENLTSKFKLSRREFQISADDVEKWHNSSIDYSPIYKDADGVEWVPMFLFDTRDTGLDHPDDVPRLHQFVFHNSFFFNAAESIELHKWACKQFFSRGFLSEPGDSIDFLWNEYPWSESFKSKHSIEYLKCKEHGCPTELMVTCVGELQENTEGIPPETDYISTVYAPNQFVMEMFGLYTAERGVVRRLSNDEIVSFNIYRKDISLSGMFMKKSFLMEYLQRTNQCLFVSLCGEKFGQVSGTAIGLKDFSGSYQITSDGVVACDDPLHVVERRMPEPSSSDDMFDDLFEIEQDEFEDIQLESIQKGPSPVAPTHSRKSKNKKEKRRHKKNR